MLRSAWVSILVVCLGIAGAQAARAQVAALDPDTIRIVAIGDSDTKGKNGFAGSFPGQVEALLNKGGFKVKVFNEGVESQTSTTALAQLGTTMPPGTNLLIIDLGTSDIKVNMTPDQIRQNLDTIIGRAKAQGTKVLLVAARPPGPQTPPGYDVNAYNAIFDALAAARGTGLVRFTNGLPPPGALPDPTFYLPDGHLTDGGNAIVARNVAGKAAEMLKAK